MFLERYFIIVPTSFSSVSNSILLEQLLELEASFYLISWDMVVIRDT